MRRCLLWLVIALPVILVLVPAGLVWWFSPDAPSQGGQPIDTPLPDEQSQPVIQVYRHETGKIDSLPLERYVEGVVAAEMPAEFEIEALKAQAMAVRTYIVRRLSEGRFDGAPPGAHVTDTVQHQVYLDPEQLKARWGDAYAWKLARVRKAVRETAGVILTYQGKPIDATFFSTSNGFTENADEYWNTSIPYLKSVASPWDAESPRFEETLTIPVAEFERKLGVRLDAGASDGSWYTVLERTTGNRVGSIRIGDKVFTGREVRERLGLNSTAFRLERRADNVVITTRGYGHGVGMSQWGANGMAKSGKSAEEIVRYFYQGVSLQKVSLPAQSSEKRVKS